MDSLLFSLALVPILGVLGQWIAWRTRLPSIIILLFLGFLAGPILSLIDTDQVFGDILYPLVSLLVSVIVFEGGLNLRIKDLKNIAPSLFRLVLIAPIITIGLMYLLTHYLLGLSSELSIMFSALMVITGPTVIIPLLRHIKVSPKISSLIRWEGILIAPIGTFLIVLVYQSVFIETAHVLKITMLLLIKIMAVSTFVGLFFAYLIILFFKRNWVPDFLQELITLIIVFVAFLGSNFVQQDSGILTVVLMGIILANQQQIPFQHVKVFKENLRILSISTLFIVLSSRLVFDDLLALMDLQHFLYLLSLIFIVRPVATFLTLIGTSLKFKERLLMAWIAPRGIVTASIASLFALRLVNLGVPQAEVLVPLTFLVLIFTVCVYGFSLNPFIKMIKLEDNDKIGILIVGANKIAVAIARLLNSIDNIDVTVVDLNRKRVQYSRLDGVKALHTSVFSSRVVEDMQLGAYRSLISLTENDEVNSLACIQYSEVVGPQNVFRFPPISINSMQSEGTKKMDLGQQLVEFDFHFITSIFKNNDSFKIITIIDDMNLADFTKQYGENLLPILGVSPTNAIKSAKGVELFQKNDRWIVLDK
ncbi:MAG: cation:proton antiporter, partial [Candidatus Margulisiibacteriota bacterium]|nr:cation:proton antiporter [Candidatus Margulisiibacteriota bacterium]